MDNLVLKLLSIENINNKIIKFLINNFSLNINCEKDLKEALDYYAYKNNNLYRFSLDSIKKGFDKAEKTIYYSEKLGIKSIDILNKKYPKNLINIKDSPLILFYKGNFDILDSRQNIAIVGTRNPSDYGINSSYNISKFFSYRGFNIVSGLATGCDEYAHKGIVDSKSKGIAVLAGGIDKIYPKKNEHLAYEILINNGCLVSEYPIFTNYFKYNFVRRNRIQSGLSEALILIECSEKSGSIYTVDFCIKQEKILAVCDIDNLGNQKIIKENKNVLIIKDKSSLIRLENLIRNTNKEIINQVKFKL